MSIGEVKKCSHCAGSGKCSCRGCSGAIGVAASHHHPVVCAACDGKGSVWVGPEIVHIRDRD